MPPARPRTQSSPLEANMLMTAVLCLLAGGAVMVYSASSARTLLQGQGDGSTYLVRYVMYGAVGLVVMQLMRRRGLDAVIRYTGPFLGVCFFLLLLVHVPGIGVTVNGARRWLGAGPLQFQPSELMKLAFVLYTVKLVATKPKIVREARLLVPLLGVFFAAALLIVSQPDLGTVLVIGATLVAILVCAGIPGRYLAIGFGGAVVLLLLLAVVAPYRRARLTAFMDPWQHAGTIGFQSVQGQIAIGSGGLFGRGIGESVQKIFYLPEAHTDFILAIIGEEVGVAGIAVLLFLYGLIAYAGLRVAKAATGNYAKLLAAGLTAMVLCQASLNVFAVLGLAPLTGVPLPFISYGSTNLVVLLGAMGLLLNIADGGQAHIRAVPTPRRRHAGGSRADDPRRDRSRRDSGARGARARGRGRAAG